MPTNNAINLSSAGIPSYDGSGSFSASTTTDHALLLGDASNTINNLVLTDGQLPIGTTGADPTAATLTGGTGIGITNAAGSITINAVGGGMTTIDATNATYTILVNTSYEVNRGGGVVFTLPASATIQDQFEIVGKLGTWSIAENANQQIFIGSLSSTATTGGLASTNVGDCVTCKCITAGASTFWRVTSMMGNVTVT